MTIRVIMLITPKTSEARVREIDALHERASRLLGVQRRHYYGAQKDSTPGNKPTSRGIENMNLRNPRMVGSASAQADIRCRLRPLIRRHHRHRFVTLLKRKGGRCRNRPSSSLKEEVARMMSYSLFYHIFCRPEKDSIRIYEVDYLYY